MVIVLNETVAQALAIVLSRMIEFDVVAELTEVNHITEAVADTKKESFLFDSVQQTRTRGVPIDRATKLYRETAVALRCLA